MPDGATARSLVAEREIYGAYAPRASSGQLLIATAASQPVTGVLQQTFAAVDAQRKVQTVVTDVKPLPEGDAGGASGYLLILAITVLSIAVAWMLELRVPSIRQGLLAVGTRLGLLAGFGILSGLALALVATSFGAFDGYVLELAGTLALTSFAVTTITSVATSLLGGPLGLVAPLTLFLLVGILAASGATSAPEFLPDFWRGFGSILPPRSGIDLIRNTAYFGGEAITTPVIVLSAFSAAGAALMLALVPLRNLRDDATRTAARRCRRRTDRRARVHLARAGAEHPSAAGDGHGRPHARGPRADADRPRHAAAQRQAAVQRRVDAGRCADPRVARGGRQPADPLQPGHAALLRRCLLRPGRGRHVDVPAHLDRRPPARSRGTGDHDRQAG